MNRRIAAARETWKAFPGTLNAMEAFLAELGLRNGWFERAQDCFATELLLREMLTNAVEHGCRCSPERQIRCRVRREGNHLFIAVKDDGQGFEWRNAGARAARPSEASGRGMEILRTYATRFRFSASGNAVMVWKTIGREKNDD